jgi:hypothetical protein
LRKIGWPALNRSIKPFETAEGRTPRRYDGLELRAIARMRNDFHFWLETGTIPKAVQQNAEAKVIQ